MVHSDPALAEDGAVVGQVDAESRRQLAGSATELPQRPSVPARRHGLYAGHRFESTDKDGTRHPFGLAHEVEHVVVAIREVDVGRAGRSVHHGVACGDALRRCMTSSIVHSEVCFSFNDHATREQTVDERFDDTPH